MASENPRLSTNRISESNCPSHPGSIVRLYLDCHRTTQGTGGEVVIILQHLVQEMPLLGLFFPPSSCLTTLATRAPSRVFYHAVTVYAHYGAAFSCGWDLKFCFAVGKDLLLCLWY